MIYEYWNVYSIMQRNGYWNEHSKLITKYILSCLQKMKMPLINEGVTLLRLRNIEIKRGTISNNGAVVMSHFDGASGYSYFAVSNGNLNLLVPIAAG